MNSKAIEMVNQSTRLLCNTTALAVMLKVMLIFLWLKPAFPMCIKNQSVKLFVLCG